MENNATIELPEPATPHTWPPPVRLLGHTVSVIFHPLLIPAYITAFILFKDPYAFAAFSNKDKLVKLASVAYNTAFLPFFAVVLMKLLGFVKSILLPTQKDRIIPYIVSMIFYFNAWYVSKNLHDSSSLVAMLLAVFLCSIAGMMANIYYKISMHAIAAGALFVFFIWMAFAGTFPLGSWLAIAVLITGLVCTARFIVSDHNGFDIYTGLMAGALCQLVAIAIAG